MLTCIFAFSLLANAPEVVVESNAPTLTEQEATLEEMNALDAEEIVFEDVTGLSSDDDEADVDLE